MEWKGKDRAANPDAENRLVSVTEGAYRTEFEHEPLGRRSRSRARPLQYDHSSLSAYSQQELVAAFGG